MTYEEIDLKIDTEKIMRNMKKEWRFTLKSIMMDLTLDKGCLLFGGGITVECFRQKQLRAMREFKKIKQLLEG